MRLDKEIAEAAPGARGSRRLFARPAKAGDWPKRRVCRLIRKLSPWERTVRLKFLAPRSKMRRRPARRCAVFYSGLAAEPVAFVPDGGQRGLGRVWLWKK